MKRAIYGVSSKYNPWGGDHRVVRFDDMDTAHEWLYTEEYDFREREICTKTRAIEIAGKKAVEAAETVYMEDLEGRRKTYEQAPQF